MRNFVIRIPHQKYVAYQMKWVGHVACNGGRGEGFGGET